jgi:hypothetical protein
MLDNLLNQISDSEVVKFLIVELEKTQEKPEKARILYLLKGTKHCITKKQKQQLRELLIDNFVDYKENAFNVLHLCEEMELFDDNAKLIKLLREIYEENLIDDSGFWVFVRIIEIYNLADDLADLIVKEFETEASYQRNNYKLRLAECFFLFAKSENIKKVNDVLEKQQGRSQNANLFKSNKLATFIDNLATIYNSGKDYQLFNEIFRLAIIFEKNYLTYQSKAECNFFILTNEVEKFYNYVNEFFDKNSDKQTTKLRLLCLSSDEMVRLCANDFILDKLDKEFLFYYRRGLADQQRKLFTDLINAGLDNFFDVATKENNEKIAIIEDYTQRQFKMLLDSKLMIEELENVFQLAYDNRKNKNLESITRDDLFEVNEEKSLNLSTASHWVDIFGIRILDRYVFNKTDNWKFTIEEMQHLWFNFSSEDKEFIGLNELVENYDVDRHKQYKEVLLPKIQVWVAKNAPLLDLESAEKYYNGAAKVIKELHKKDLAQISESVLLDLLHFNTINTEDYKEIAETVGIDKVIARIKENLGSPTRKAKMLYFYNGNVVGFYSNFIREKIINKAEQNEFATLFYEWLLATKSKEEKYFEGNCLETIIAFQPNESKLLENLLDKMVIEDDFLGQVKTKLIEELVKRKSTKVKNYLSEIFKTDTITDLENFRIASQLAFLGKKSAWEYIANNLQAYHRITSQMYFAPFWFITDFDFTNGKFIEYLQQMFSDLIRSDNYGGVYDKYMLVYSDYANQNKDNYQFLVNHIKQHLAKDKNGNIQRFLSDFQFKYAEKQVIHRSIEELLVDF